MNFVEVMNIEVLKCSIKRSWPLQKWCMNKKLTLTGFSTEPSGEPVLVGFA